MPTDLRQYWNHNTNYYRRVVRAVPDEAASALDVGTGDGLPACDLRERVHEVVGIDLDPTVLARARSTGADVEWLQGDFMSHSLPLSYFDLVTSVATLHHLPDLAGALTRLADLTAPRGRIVVIGCARPSTVREYAVESLGIAQHKVLSRTRGFWQHSAAVQMRFPHAYREAHAITAATLPGAKWRQHPVHCQPLLSPLFGRH